MSAANGDDVKRIRESKLFDEKWYLEQYPDVQALGMDPIEHYLWLGATLGRNPSPSFSTKTYLSQNSDVANAALNPFVHFVRWGQKEGRARNDVSDAEVATRARDWPRALASWQRVLKNERNGVLLRGRAKLNVSVLSRLCELDAYKTDITNYLGAAERRAERRPRVAVYSAIIGNYDTLKLPEHVDPHFSYIAFTDTDLPETGIWQTRRVNFESSDKTRIARFVKTNPHRLLGEYDIAVWVDSNIMITGDINPLIEEFLNSGAPIAGVPHPERTSIYEELEACISAAKDDESLMRRQVERYLAGGFVHGDLIETNVMIFALNDSRTQRILTDWWSEIENNSRRDQLSINYVLNRNGVSWHRISQRPVSIRNHPLFAFGSHGRHDDGLSSELIDALAPLGPNKLLADGRHARGYRVFQFTPEKTSNSYYSMFPLALRRRGLDICCTTNWEQVSSSPGVHPIVHFHQLEPFYHKADRTLTWAAAQSFMQKLEDQSRQGRRMVLTWHNPYPHDRRYLEIDEWVYNRISKSVSAVIVHLKAAVPFVSKFIPPNKIRYLPHPSYADNFSPQIDRAIARSQLGIGDDKFVFITFGAMKHYKGIDDLAESWRRFKSSAGTQNESSLLYMAGKLHSPELADKLSGLSDVVLDLEYVQDQRLAVYLSAADAAIFGHKEIWTSGSAILAMSFGLPVIMPDSPYTREYVRNDHNGFLYNSRDSDALVAAMSAIVRCPYLNHMRFTNKADAEMNSVDIVAPRLERIYSEIANGAGLQ